MDRVQISKDAPAGADGKEKEKKKKKAVAIANRLHRSDTKKFVNKDDLRMRRSKSFHIQSGILEGLSDII